MVPQNSLKFLLLFCLLLCGSTTKISAQKANQFDGYPTVKAALNKKVWTANKSYYLIVKASDSTVHLYWGNDSLKRKYDTDLDLSSAEKLNIKWTSKNYLILQYGTGSGAWIDIVLPINKQETVQGFANGICFDKIYNLFAYEGYGDTIVIVRNLKTKKEQFIIDKEHRCDASNNDCIHTVEIKNKLLYVKWTIPNNFTDEKKKIYQKKIKLQI